MEYITFILEEPLLISLLIIIFVLLIGVYFLYKWENYEKPYEKMTKKEKIFHLYRKIGELENQRNHLLFDEPWKVSQIIDKYQKELSECERKIIDYENHYRDESSVDYWEEIHSSGLLTQNDMLNFYLKKYNKYSKQKEKLEEKLNYFKSMDAEDADEYYKRKQNENERLSTLIKEYEKEIQIIKNS